MEIRRHPILISLIVISVLILFMYPELFSALFVLVFMGVVPGTAITLPSWVTLSLFVIALIFGIRWLLDQPSYRPVATHQDLSRRAAARKRVLKQTSRRASSHRYRKQTAKA